MNRRATFAMIAVTTLVGGCAPSWMAANPDFATGAPNKPGGQVTSVQPSGPPGISAPKTDLSWRDCTARVFAAAAVPAAAGVKLDCASYDADLDTQSGASGTVSVGAVRARSAQTPSDAGPLVFTTGSDLPSSLQLSVWLSRAGAEVLRSHPIVAVDRRGIGPTFDGDPSGIGMPAPIDCRQAFDRTAMWNQAQFESGNDQVANLADVAMLATTDCTDFLDPGASSYSAVHAADDLEQLRSQWDVPALALIGIGDGAQTALAYAASHPDKVARLVLDSPTSLGAAAEAVAEQRVKGQQDALDAFAAQCVAVNCALGADPKDAITALFTSARTGSGLGGVSAAALAEAITTALGFPGGDGAANVTDLADTLAAARSGDTARLTDLVNRAEDTRQTDGQFVNVCSDATSRPTPDRVRELVVAWGKLYPQFGAVAALDLAKCLHWPSSSPAEPPSELKVNVLLLGVRYDPVVGGEGVAATAANIINAGAASKRVMWQGIGHGASIYSSCAVGPLIGYLDSGKLPDTDTYCPA